MRKARVREPCRPHRRVARADPLGVAGTRDALHLWTQIVGKVRMALSPMVNHWWHVPLYVSARGLTTSLMRRARGLEIEFDFLDHRLTLRTTDGEARHLELDA